MATTAAAAIAANTATHIVEAIETENASWMAVTICPMNGSTAGRACLRHRRQDLLAEVDPDVGQVRLAARAGRGEAIDDRLRHAMRGELSRDLGGERAAEDRAGDRQAHRSADLAEEGQRAGGGAEHARARPRSARSS